MIENKFMYSGTFTDLTQDEYNKLKELPEDELVEYVLANIDITDPTDWDKPDISYLELEKE